MAQHGETRRWSVRRAQDRGNAVTMAIMKCQGFFQGVVFQSGCWEIVSAVWSIWRPVSRSVRLLGYLSETQDKLDEPEWTNLSQTCMSHRRDSIYGAGGFFQHLVRERNDYSGGRTPKAQASLAVKRVKLPRSRPTVTQVAI